ncbi:MAG: Ig-like domain-containing protein [Blautia sp.]|nr:Ig-like domain-containing protein [Lachnoclostridium sp.]MCM1211554.1 Ig-like domain-containing protein [Blautia sp.]
MKKTGKHLRRTISALLTAALLAASLPQPGVDVFAAGQEAEVSSQAGEGLNAEWSQQSGEDFSAEDSAQPGNDSNLEDPSRSGEGSDTEEPAQPGDDFNTGDPVQPGNGSDIEDPSQSGDGSNTEDPAQPEGGSDVEDPTQPGNDSNMEDPIQPEDSSETEDSTQPEEESSPEEVSGETELDDEEMPETQPNVGSTASAGDGDYLVYDDSLENLTVTPGSYHASIEAKMHVNTNLNFCIIYTTNDASQNDFFPGQDSLEDARLNGQSMLEREGYGIEDLNYTPHWGGKYYDSWTADFSGKNAFDSYAPGGLTPETTYRFRLAYRTTYASTITYRFLSVPQEFTTKAAVETSAVSFQDISVDEVGYAAARISWTLDNPDNEFIIQTEVIGYEELEGDGEREIEYSREIGACLDEEGYMIPGRYYALIDTTGKEQDFYLKLQVYTGVEKEKQTITAPEAIHIMPDILDDDKVTADITPSTAALRASVNISPWHDVDAARINNGFKVGSLYLYVYYRTSGTTASWQYEYQNINQDSAGMMIEGLSPNTTYEYYVTVSGQKVLWSRGSEEEPLTFTTTPRVVYEDSDFPDEVLRSYIKQHLEISSTAKITSDKLDTLTFLVYSNNYPNANYPDQYKGTGVIRSLEGIQYIKNLNNISLYNHEITDASILGSLSGLEYVDLQLNDITELPDLSGLSLLQSAKFEANKITADSITGDKLPAAFLEKNPNWISGTVNSQLSAAGTPAKEQIIQRYAELPWSTGVANTYAEKPSITAPYAAGRLSDTSLANACNMLNFVRYVAGVRDDISLSEAQMEVVQAGTLVNAVNQQMSHFPACPKGFPSELYALGSSGCAHSSLAVGFSNLSYSILAWMYDSDYTNMDQVGHRRGAIDPTIKTTGFGAVTNGATYSGMHVNNMQGPDRKRGGTISDFVAWPARNTPTQLMSGTNCAWSISLGSDYYMPDTSAVTVTLKNTSTGKKWTFNSGNSNMNGNYFNIDTMGGFGLFNCIIFRPNPADSLSYAAGTRYEVSVSGLTDRTGSAKPLSYTVEFFSLPTIVEPTGVSLDKTALNMQPGETVALTASVKPDNAKNKDVKWSSSNAEVAAVDEEGTVTAIAPGDAVITASTFNGKTAACKIKVRQYSIDKTELQFDLAEGVKTETLTVSDGIATIKTVKWSSSDERVATVSGNNKGNGIVTPTGSGSAIIRAQITNGPRLSCTVTVKKEQLTSISLSAESCSMEKGSTRQLKVYIIPEDTTLSKDILWSSDKPAVVSVGDDGLVHAVSGGTAVITASIGDCTAECVVTVYEKAAAPVEESIPKNLFALTNVQTRLSDISLQDYEGWKWVYGDAALTKFAGQQQKSFAAIYSREGYADWQDSLTVSLFTLTGMQIMLDGSTLGKGAEAAARIQWNIDGPENSISDKIMSEYEKNLVWSSSRPSVVKVTGEGASARLEAAGIGKASVKAQITLGKKTYKAQYAVTVVEGTPAGIVLDSVDGLETVPADTEGIQAYKGNTAQADAALQVTITNASRLTVKSNNTKVVTVGKAASVSDGTYSIPLAVKAAGTARITLTVNDAAKTSRDILLYITDPKPNISENIVTINRLKTDGTTFDIYPNDGYSVEKVTLAGTDASRFTLAKEEDSVGDGSYRITANADTTKGTYKVEVKALVGGTDYALPLTVKVVEQKAKYTVKQSAKANLFYKDLGAPQLVVTSNEKLTDIALEECDFKIEAADGIYQIMPKTENALTASCDKKGTLKITFDGYDTICANFTVGVVTKAPKLSLDNKSVTLYPNAGLTTARLKVLCEKQTFGLKSIQCSSRFKIAGNELVLNGSDIDLSKASSVKEKIILSSADWTGSVTLSCTVKVNMGAPALKLQKSTLQLNANASTWAYDMGATEVMWKEAAAFDMEKTPISVCAVNKKSQELMNVGILFESAEGSRVIARLNHKEVAAGTYKFKVNVKVSDDCTVSTPLTVKIVNKDISKAVSYSAKGSIDVLNREGSFVTVTPSFKTLNGGSVSDRVSLSGRSAHLFYGTYEENKFIIRAKKNVALITKYNYGVCLNYTVKNADGETMQISTPEIKLKLKQGKPKVSLTPKGGAFFSGAYNSAPVRIDATLKGAPDPVIETVELTNGAGVFQYENERIALLKEGTSVKGKAYSLKFKVTFKGHADNEKPVTVTYSAKVR